MAMSSLQLHVFPWFQGHNSPQLDFIEGLTEYDTDFEHVTCKYYSNSFVYMLRGLTNHTLKQSLIQLFSALPGKGDYMNVTPYVLHFGWLHITCVLCLPPDELIHLLMKIEGGDLQNLKIGGSGKARQSIKQVGHLLGHLFMGGHKAQVGVELGRFGIIIPGT